MKLQLAAAFAALVACAPSFAQQDAGKTETAETIHWPVPWKVGQVFTYETESLDAEQAPNKREKTRSTDTTKITITEATTDGYVQRWISTAPKVQMLEGDANAAKLMESLATSLTDLVILVELDKEATYKRIRNIDEISTRMRAALKPLLDAEVEKGIAKAKGDDIDTKAALEQARGQLDKMLDGLSSPAYLEAVLGQVVQNYNAFVGIALEDGASYSVESELDNPLGGRKFPATVEFGLYVSEDDPEDVFLEWTSTIDPERGAEAIWELAEKLVGMQIPKEQRKELPTQVSIVDEGFVIFNRSSGVIEMYENERKVDLGDTHKSDRDRMRLVDGEHEHEWKEGGAAAGD